MKIVEYAKTHPYATGTVVIIGGILFIMIVRGGNGSNSDAPSGPSDAQIAAQAGLQAAQIQAQAGIQAAQIGAGVQLNSDNKAAEVALEQLRTQKAIYTKYFASQTDTAKAAIDAEVRAKSAAIAGIANSSAKGRYKAAGIDAIITGQNTFQFSGNAGSSGGLGSILGLGGIGGVLSGIGSIFSDERLKENIAWIGHDKNGRNLYSYNYRGSKTKRVGYIAQDIARAEPDKITTGKGGYSRIVNLLPPRPTPVSLRSY